MERERLLGHMLAGDAWGNKWSWLAAIIILVSAWVIFTKANKPGWAAIIPIYSTLVFLQIINKPWWWLLLVLVPFVNIVIGIMMNYELAKAFGKDGWFTLGMIFLPFIFFPLLAWGDAKYHKPN